MKVTWITQKEIKTLRQEELAMKRQRRMKRSWMGRILEKTFDPCKKKNKKKRKGEVNNKICYPQEYIQRGVGSDEEDLSLPSFPDVAISREGNKRIIGGL